MILKDLFKPKSKIDKELEELELIELRKLKNYKKAQEKREASLSIIDRDEDKWETIGSGSDIRQPTEETLSEYREISRGLYKWNPHAKSVIRNEVKFIVGTGFTIQPFFPLAPPEQELQENSQSESKNTSEDNSKSGAKYLSEVTSLTAPDFSIKKEATSEALPDFSRKPGRTRDLDKTPPTAQSADEKLISLMNFYWMKFMKVNKWKKRRKEIVRRTYRDGETFLRFFPQGDTLITRFIDPDDVRDTTNTHSWGIETDPNDVENVKAYHVIEGASTESKSIPAEEIQHIKEKDTDSDVKRGEPFLLSVMKRVQQYDTWIQDRVTLNKVRASIALLRKWKGATPQGLKNFADSKATTTVTKTTRTGTVNERQRRMKPGTILDVPKDAEYEYLAPDVQAGDVRHDGRSILLSVAAGTGQPEYMVTGDASNANYSSTMVQESPAVREFEDGQEYFGEAEAEVWRRLRDYLVNENFLPNRALMMEVEVQAAQLIVRNRLNDVQADEILFLNKVISPQVWSGREGVSYDKVRKEWEEVLTQPTQSKPSGETSTTPSQNSNNTSNDETNATTNDGDPE
jgi:hypothetical protein